VEVVKKLGKVQADVLAALWEHGYWSPDYRCGWLWTTPSETKRIMDSLVNAGYAVVNEEEIAHRERTIGGSRGWTEDRTVYRPLFKAPRK
jgi:hypothetical protein